MDWWQPTIVEPVTVDIRSLTKATRQRNYCQYCAHIKGGCENCTREKAAHGTRLVQLRKIYQYRFLRD